MTNNIEMDNDGINPGRSTNFTFLTLLGIVRLLYGVLFWMAAAVEILFCVLTLQYTVTFDYFCGNPLMGYWAQWFVISMVAIVIMLPGGLWSIRHKNQRAGLIILIGFIVCLLSMMFMLIAGVVFGTVPDFINFIGYAFG